MAHKHSSPSPIPVRSTCSDRVPPPVSIAATEPLYSIRLADRPGTACALCLEPTGAGPVGYLEDDPVCDRCLLDSCSQLGMVLALVAVTREYAAVEPSSDEELQEGLTELGAFARIYERVAQRSGPRRKFRLSDPEGDPVN